MPELPEVEVVRRGIEPYTRDWVVDRVRVYDPRSLKRHDGPEEDFIERLTGRTLHGAVRRGKFLWIPVGDGEALVCHLGMSGQVLLGDAPSQFGPLLRVALELVGPGEQRMVWGFVDQRLFGSLAIDTLVDSGSDAPAGYGHPSPDIPRQVAHIARDALDQAFDEQAVVRKIRQKTSGIKRVLLDQGVLSGVGNIYADEALWRARLHYDYPANRLTAKKARELLGHIRDVFGQALEDGGTSFDWQYVNVNGQSGYFSQSLNAYGQDGHPCPRCGRPIRREPFMNRSSFRCPRCQPTPRRPVG